MTIWCRAKDAVLDFPPAVPIDRFSAPQRTGEPQTFEQASDTLFERHTRCSEFLANISGKAIGLIGRVRREFEKPSLIPLQTSATLRKCIRSDTR